MRSTGLIATPADAGPTSAARSTPDIIRCGGVRRRAPSLSSVRRGESTALDTISAVSFGPPPFHQRTAEMPVKNVSRSPSGSNCRSTSTAASAPLASPDLVEREETRCAEGSHQHPVRSRPFDRFAEPEQRAQAGPVFPGGKGLVPRAAVSSRRGSARTLARATSHNASGSAPILLARPWLGLALFRWPGCPMARGCTALVAERSDVSRPARAADPAGSPLRAGSAGGAFWGPLRSAVGRRMARPRRTRVGLRTVGAVGPVGSARRTLRGRGGRGHARSWPAQPGSTGSMPHRLDACGGLDACGEFLRKRRSAL